MLLLFSICLAACQSDEDELFTTADITLTAGDSITISRAQGTVSLTNLNSQAVTNVTDFTGNTAHATILRGAYSIYVEGTVEYSRGNGPRQISRFRAYTDYVGLEKENGNAVALNISLMD